jgi:DNA-binding transcriptional MerR regulator
MPETRFLLVEQRREPLFGVARVTIEELSSCCEIHPELVARFVTLGLLDPLGRNAAGDMLFDAGAILLVRKILRLRHDLGVNYAGIGLVLDLMTRIDELEGRVRELERARCA